MVLHSVLAFSVSSNRLVMTISLDHPKQILEARIEALKLENLINEDVGRMIRTNLEKEKLEPRDDGTCAYTVEVGYHAMEIYKNVIMHERKSLKILSILDRIRCTKT
jgi:hypothetical protein